MTTDAARIEHRSYGLLEVKLDDDNGGTFEGYGAVFGNVDSYGDVIERKAFAEDLGEWKKRRKWPKMLLQHGAAGFTSDDMMPVGQWTHMEEDDRGLKVHGRLFALNTERGQYIYEGLKSGELDSLSIGFEAKEWKMGSGKGEPTRTLTKIKLWEVSIVTFPANDRAKISGVKTLTLEELREFEASLRDGGLSQREARIASSLLKKWLQRDAAAPISSPPDEDVPDHEAAEVLKLVQRDVYSAWAAAIRA
jgi:uncharacterized protein